MVNKKKEFNKDYHEMVCDSWSHLNSIFDETHKTMRSVTFGKSITNKKPMLDKHITK